MALCVVRASNSGQGSSYSSTCGNRPSRVPRQKLLNALRATSSSSAIRPGRAVQLQPGGLDHSAEIDVPELLGGDRVALLQLGDPDPDRGEGAHGGKPLMMEDRIIPSSHGSPAEDGPCISDWMRPKAQGCTNFENRCRDRCEAFGETSPEDMILARRADCQPVGSCRHFTEVLRVPQGEGSFKGDW